MKQKSFFALGMVIALMIMAIVVFFGSSQRGRSTKEQLSFIVKTDSATYQISFEKADIIVYEISPQGKLIFNERKQIREYGEENDSICFVLADGDILKIPAKEFHAKVREANKDFANYLEQPWEEHEVTIIPSPVYE